MRASRFSIVLLVGALVFGASTASARPPALSVQDLDSTGYPSITFKVGLPPSMVATASEPVFEVAENGIVVPEVTATPLAGPGSSARVVLLIDASGSMRGRPLADAKAAATRFVDSLGQGAEVGVIAFSDSPRLLVGMTSDRERLRRAIDSLNASGETALYDGVVMAATLVRAPVPGQRGIVLLSDGGDTVSVNGLDKALDSVRNAGVPVYAVALRSKEDNRKALELLASQTGGRLAPAGRSSEFASLFEDIASEIRNTYVVTYRSLRPQTKDVDLDVSVRAAGGTAAGAVAFANPRFAGVGTEPADGPAAMKKIVDQPLLVLALAALIFCSIVLLVGVSALMLVRVRADTDQLKYYDQLRTDNAEMESTGTTGEMRSKVVDAVGTVAGKRGITPAVTKRLEAAGLPLRAAEYMTMHIGAVIVIGAAVELLMGNLPLSVLAVIISTIAPIVVLDVATSSRRKRFESQLPDILNMISSSLRGGWGIQQAIALVVRQAPAPSSAEFRRVDAETRLGLPLERALERMADRLSSTDFHAAASAIAIQREVGGNLAEVLDVVATTIRERESLRRHVKSLTAESRLSAYILIALPFLILGMLLILNRPYMIELLTTAIGLTLGTVGLVLLVIGIIWISAVSKVEV